MTTVNKKRIRILPTGSSNSDDVDEGNPKSHENGGKVRALEYNKADNIENVVKSNTCLVCDGEDDLVLICHGEECPIAIHQSCISDEPDFDEHGNFYCPYCWYKRVGLKCVTLGKKLNSRKGRETLGGVDLGLMMNQETDEGRKGRARGSWKNHEKEQVRNSDVGEEREPHRRCHDINHDTSQAHVFVVDVKTRQKRRYSEKNQQNKTVAGTHEQNVFINDDRTQVRDSGLGEGRSGQGCCHENSQQKKVTSTERREQEVPMTDIRVSHGSRLGEGRHIEKNQHTETIETETREKEISKDRKRKRERRMHRDGDEFFMVENQDRKCQADMRNDDVAYNEQGNGFSTVEHVERKSVSSISSPESTDNVNKRNAASQELALIIHPKFAVQERPIEAQPLRSVSSKKPSFQPENYGHKSYLVKNGTTYNDPGPRNFDLCSDKKRKRLLWTQAEEEMLRVGVQKFPGSRNIPWRKILEFGVEVFQSGRVPSDLKDKWKLMNKMRSSTGKWVSQPNYYVSEVSSE